MAEGLWPWALRIYAREGVEALCLQLQDAHGHSVPYLLWAAWMADQGRAAPPDTLAWGAALARAWEAEVIGPLRQVRRRLRPEGVESLRAEVKAAELGAEQALMGRLEAGEPGVGTTAALEAALLAAGLAWNPGADPAPLKLFASLLG